MPTIAVENYLKCILLAEGAAAGGRVSMGHIGAALDVTPGTVTSMMKTLDDAGLVQYEPYSGVRLTAPGRQLAAHVVRRHRLLELFLVRVVGMDWSEVHGEADRLEHAVSDRLIERIDEMLDRPATDPHGDPIPDARGIVAQEPVRPSLLECATGQPLRVARVTDQHPEFLRLVDRQGLRPGETVVVERRDEAADAVVVRSPGRKRWTLGFRAASKILVDAAA